jgi:hypothetical protein
MRLPGTRALIASCLAAFAFAFACVAEARGADALSAATQELRLGLDYGGKGDSWAVAVNKGRPDIRVVLEGGAETLQMRSSRSSFGLQRKAKVDLGRYPVLSWRWKVDELPEGGDYRYPRTADQAAQLYVAFSSSRAIGYVWDSSAPAGSTGDCALPPPFMKVRIMVLRSGPGDAGRWALERRDLRLDYESLFGEKMPESKEIGLRIWINSQHTGSSAASAFADLAFGR